MSELIHLNILNTIRENSNCIPFQELESILSFRDYSHIKCNFHPLIDLCNENYIRILDVHKNNITDTICKMNYDESYNFLYDSLFANKDILYIELTDKLSKIQSLLGFSLNDTIIKYKSNFSFMATPTFGCPENSLQTDIFVIMPFQEEFDYLYQNYIKKVCKRINVSCMRADDLYSSKPIMQDIWSLIYNSKVVIADCSTKNPNVMYELGIAHAIGKEVILITQDVNDIPFDLRHLRHLHYKYTPHSINLFEDDLEYALYPYFK